MKKINLFLLLNILLIVCGISVVQAKKPNGLKVENVSNDNTTECICMDVTEQKSLTVSYHGGDGYVIESASWEIIGGGITIVSGSENIKVTVASLSGGDYSEFSKGRLGVTCKLKKQYNDSTCCTCNGVTTCYPYTWNERKELYMEIDVCKQFNYSQLGMINEIVGPECVALNEQVTYSIQPWVSKKDAAQIGFDSYKWNQSSIADYHSSDKSSITFTVNNNFIANPVLSVSMGTCNSSQHIQRTLTQKPEAARIKVNNTEINWETGLCLPFGAGETTITIFNADPNNPNVTYEWQKLEGWVHRGETSSVLTFDPVNTSREIRLVVKSLCEDKIYDLKIRRSFASDSKITNTTQTPNCLNQGTDVVFSVIGAGAGIPMTWYVEPGKGWIVKQNGISTPTITVGNLPCLISVTDECGNTISDTFYPNPAKPSISGSTCVAQNPIGGTVPFNVTSADPAAVGGYSWELKGTNWTIQSGQNTTAISVKSGTGSATLTVSAIGHCNNKIASNTLTLNLEPTAPTGINNLSSCINYNLTGTATFSVPTQPGESYSWNIPSSFGTPVGTPNGTNGTITVNTKGISGIIGVQVDAKGTCQASNWKYEPFFVTSNGLSLTYADAMGFAGYRINNSNALNITSVDYKLYINEVAVPNGVMELPAPFNIFALTGLPFGTPDINNSNIGRL
jgi:hypothetical protein